MNVVSHSTLVTFYEKHPSAKSPLEKWYKTVRKTEWMDFNDVKIDFSSADFIGNQRFVFNVGGNKYRIVAIIRFKIQHLFIRFVGTHAEYDKIKDIQNI